MGCAEKSVSIVPIVIGPALTSGVLPRKFQLCRFHQPHSTRAHHSERASAETGAAAVEKAPRRGGFGWGWGSSAAEMTDVSTDAALAAKGPRHRGFDRRFVDDNARRGLIAAFREDAIPDERRNGLERSCVTFDFRRVRFGQRHSQCGQRHARRI